MNNQKLWEFWNIFVVVTQYTVFENQQKSPIYISIKLAMIMARKFKYFFVAKWQNETFSIIFKTLCISGHFEFITFGEHAQ